MQTTRTLRRAALALSLLIAATAGASSQLAAADRLADVAPLPGLPPLTLSKPDGTSAHIYPTVALDKARKKALSGRSLSPVTYHGGKIMPSVKIYAIYWAPPTLQTGAATSIPPIYRAVTLHMIQNYAGHAISNINTQYYQTVSGVTTYHTGLGNYYGTYTDTDPYPASGCTDSFTPGNCLSDTQLRAEVQKVMTLKGWTGGFDKIFVLFTSSGEGSCFDAGSTSCAYVQYCAYHSWFGPSATPIIYSNEPYGNNSVCQVAGPLPNPGTSDAAATAARHEISEATTDPQLNAWWDSTTGEETSDKCAYQYGTRTWDFVGGSFLANYMWGGFFFLLQQEYSNHVSGCVLQGP